MTIQYKKSNLKLTILLLTSLTLTSCGKEEPDRATIHGKAKYDASIIIHEIHADYLNCYPLDPRGKAACLEKVANKYLKELFERDYQTYKKAFQYESEKLGFKYFLNSKGLTCNAVLQSPLFDDKEKAYLVICSAKYQYYMQFDYDNKQWELKTGK